MPARSPHDRTWHELGGQMLPRTGVRGMIGGVRAAASDLGAVAGSGARATAVRGPSAGAAPATRPRNS